jgi:hypothetical protein
MMGQSNHTRKSSGAWIIKRIVRPFALSITKSRGDCCVSTECGDIFRGKRTIFELTDMVKTASCRAYPEELSGL